MAGWEIGDDGGQRRLLCASRYHVPGDVTPRELCVVGYLGICEYLSSFLCLPAPKKTCRRTPHTAVETHVPLRVAGRGGGGRRRCVQWQWRAQSGAGAKTNYVTQNRRKHERPE